MEHAIFYHEGGKTAEEAQKILDAFIAVGVNPNNTVYDCTASEALYVAIDDRLEIFTRAPFIDYFKKVGVELPVFFGKFKTGDYVVNTLEGFIGIIDTCDKDKYAVKDTLSTHYTFKAILSTHSLEVSYNAFYDVSFSSEEDVLRKATEVEEDILDSFIAKKNKVYDSETNELKNIEDADFESSYIPKPFDKVLGWDNDENKSHLDIFLEFIEDNNLYHYRCTRSNYKHVKPYKE